MSGCIFRVAISVPLYTLFDYSNDDAILPGCRVLVPFGPRKCVGIVMEEISQSTVDASKLKAVIAVLDHSPVLSSYMLSIARWLSEYYHHPIGEVLHTALPVLLRKGESASLLPSEFIRLTAGSHNKGKNALGNLIFPDDLNRSKKQRNLYVELSQTPLLKTDASKKYSSSVIKALIDKSYVEVFEQTQSAEQHWLERISLAAKPVATTEQAIAIAAILQSLHHFSCFLLEGVTGSGKTEVYLQIIEPILLSGKQVLILVPEIGLTPQTVKRFEQRFGVKIGVLHSGLNNTERLRVWQNSTHNTIPIVIGTRSSIFTPMANIGMIIVDEEHDESFKQQDGLRYHARDLAVYMANKLDIPLILGTATPSLESLHNAMNSKYRHLLLNARAGDAIMPAQHIMNITGQPLLHGIAQGLIERMRLHLKAGSQVLVFVNRRGYAPAMLCHECGFVETCGRCDNPFTYHKSQHNLQCHRCNDVKHVPTSCPQCGHIQMTTQGIGTEQLQSGLADLFPDHQSVRIDSDSVRGKGKLVGLINDINQMKYQLLIGTQILSKGHHFPNVTMVLIVNVDGALFSADFRAAEKLAQLITQLSGRAGRSEKPGEMWLQTHCPEHPLLQDLIQNGYHDFARYALLERKHALLPPYTHQTCIRCESHNKRQMNIFLEACLQVLSLFKNTVILGPFPAFIEKKQGRFRGFLIVQSQSRSYLQQAVFRSLSDIQKHPLAKTVRWSIDVNPIDFT